MKFEDAYAAFYKATWNQAWESAAYHALAEMDCRRADWETALDHLNRSLRLDTDNLRARNLKAIVLRKLKRGAEAMALFRQTLALDPLDWWARYLSGQKPACDSQTVLDLAHDFARAGLYAEGIDLLNAHGTRGSARFNTRTEGHRRRSGVNPSLPDQSWGTLPLIHYTLGWLHEQLEGARLWMKPQPQDAQSGTPEADDQRAASGAARAAALRHYRAAAASPPDYCFPSRLEEIAILEAAMRANPNDAKAPYYLGNLLYDRRRHSEAMRLWEQSARLDPGFSTVWRNLGIGYFNIRRNPAKARTAYDRAFRANPDDARLLYERDQLWKRLGEKPEKRLRELRRHPRLVMQRDDLCVEMGALLNQTGRHTEAMRLLEERNFQPWEGGEGGPLGQWVRSNLALGRAALKASRANELPVSNPKSEIRNRKSRQRHLASAAAYFEAALASPPNLGEAKHLLANQSDIHYWLGCALESLGEMREARQHWRAAATSKGDFQEMSVRVFSEMAYYSALAWEKLGRKIAGATTPPRPAGLRAEAP